MASVPLDTFVLRIFQREVEQQCRFALIAAGQIDAALDSVRSAPLADKQRSADVLWFSLQNLLVATGNVSKLLWPQPLYDSRGEHLRRSLGIGDSSVLAPRVFRNHFEHFDERLEEWARKSKHRIFVDSNIGRIGGAEETDCLRNFDPDSFTVTFRGDEYPLRPVISSLAELWKTAESEASKPPWDE